MLKADMRRCETDQDYAELSRFFLQHCREIDAHYTLQDGLVHLISTMTDYRFLLYHDQKGSLIGFTQYRYEKDQHSVFIDSALLAEEFRSSRVFYEGLRDLVQCFWHDYPEVQSLYFYAAADNPYINRLYRKFAEIAEITERRGRKEHVYASGMNRLIQYFKLEE